MENPCPLSPDAGGGCHGLTQVVYPEIYISNPITLILNNPINAPNYVEIPY